MGYPKNVYFKTEDLRTKAEEKAEKLDRSFSSYVITLIKKDLKNEV
jgi:hypothetical protein